MAPKKKKNAPAAGAPSKTAFVKGLPADMPVSDVIAKAKDAGLELSKNYVYLIRSKAKHGTGAPKGRGRGRPAQSTPRASGSLETQFANLVAEIGLSRAEELLRSVRSKFAAAAR